MIVAVIVAAGLGVRMGTSVRKQYLSLLGKPILCHTLQVFADCPAVDRLIVVLPEGQIEECRKSLLPLVKFREAQRGVLVPGGPTRQASVYHGLREIKEQSGIVLVHDGVRPLASPVLIQTCIDGARQWGACIPAVAVRDTLKRVDDGRIVETVARENMWMAQTPQAFQLPLLLAAHEAAQRDGWRATDDASLVERYGAPVKIVPGSDTNIKITTPEDVALAEFYCRKSR